MNRESFKEHLRRRLHEMLSADDRALTSSTEPNLSDEDRAKEHFDHSDRAIDKNARRASSLLDKGAPIDWEASARVANELMNRSIGGVSDEGKRERFDKALTDFSDDGTTRHRRDRKL